MNRKPCLIGRCATICLTVVLMAATASARTVYDAGKAFNEAGHNKNTFGVWSLLHASGEGMTNTKAFDSTTGASGSFAGIGGGSSPWIRVNTGSSSTQSGEEVLPNELLLHPADPKGGTESYPSDVVRFTAPEAGWYSANIFAHDTAKEANNASTTNSGVQVSVRAQGKVLVRQIVSLEDYAANNPTHRFDFQMPVRYLAAGDKIEVVVGNKYNAWSAHGSDMTGLRFTVTKEDEGAFYDSGIAMTNNIATTYANPYGNIKDGAWYYLKTSVSSSSLDFISWAPGNFMQNTAELIPTKGTRSSGGLKGFGRDSSANSPYVVVNTGATVADSTAPCELQAHPYGNDARVWTTIRFRPPESGYYSASIVARNIASGNGVDVYLLVSGNVVMNARISLASFSSTARLTFDSRLIAAEEPVDIVISPNTDPASDKTCISAIFRRETGEVYDAGKSYFANHSAGNRTDSFADLLGGGATWQLGAKTNAWCGSQFFTGLTSGDVAQNLWWLQGRFQNYQEFPYFLMATGGVVCADNTFGITDSKLAAAPQEFVAIVNEPGYQSSSPTFKATVPSDGVYRARSYARDLNNGGGDGVQVSVVANGHIAAASPVMRDSGGTIYETALGADRLWLKGGDRIEYVVDPLTNRTSDPTGLSACYEICDASPSARVINIDFGVPSSVAGRFSNHTGAGREGWSDWNKWNALRISNSTPAATVSVDNCREADGETKRNVTLTLARTSGNVTKGYTSGSMPTGSALHNNWAKSDSASDTYTFTLSKLKKNEPYTLYLYSAKGGAAGNASFTVGGVTKTADEPWNLKDTKVVARFDVASDSNGEISGTFAAADSNGGAFNGLTLVGNFPDYDPPGMIILLR